MAPHGRVTGSVLPNERRDDAGRRGEVIRRAKIAERRMPAVEEVLGAADHRQTAETHSSAWPMPGWCRPVAGSRIKPTARSWAAVLHFARGRAGTETPCRPTTER